MSINQKHFGLSDSLVNAVNEALKGNQHKIDANKNGKIDAQDFKKLRGEGAKPDFIDLDKDGNKKEPMKHAAKQAKEEVDQVNEAVETTHENPLVTVHDKNGLHTHANLSTANKIFNTNVKHTDVHKGDVTVTSGHKDKNKLKFAISKHHATRVRKLTKEEAEQVDEISDTTLKSYRTKAMQHRMGHEPGDSAEVKADRNRKTRNRSQGVRTSYNKIIGRYVKVGGNNKKTYEEVEVTEADDAVAKQIAAKKDAMQKQIQQKIAQKQMSTMQAKANKRLSSINASSHDDKEMKNGGKEKIVINPPLKEASDLPKSVVSKGHEIAKSLIKHRSKVKEPYAVGMAQAKKSAGIKEDAEQVDELSKATLKSYKSQAKWDIDGIKSDAPSTYEFDREKMLKNRLAGVKRANKKLNKKD